jgi:hypothetical protein
MQKNLNIPVLGPENQLLAELEMSTSIIIIIKIHISVITQKNYPKILNFDAVAQYRAIKVSKRRFLLKTRLSE